MTDSAHKRQSLLQEARAHRNLKHGFEGIRGGEGGGEGRYRRRKRAKYRISRLCEKILDGFLYDKTYDAEGYESNDKRRRHKQPWRHYALSEEVPPEAKRPDCGAHAGKKGEGSRKAAEYAEDCSREADAKHHIIGTFESHIITASSL